MPISFTNTSVLELLNKTLSILFGMSILLTQERKEMNLEKRESTM